MTGYHAVNLALHVLSTLVLFGILRRTLARTVFPARIRAAADGLALAIAALWTLHPLQTAAVTYVAQRTELLAGFCYLCTLFAFIRAVAGAGNTRPAWSAVAVIACLAGMAAKETMASAPLIVLLYDRTFLAGNFAAVWRQRGRLHGALMATWLLLGWLVWHGSTRGGTAGWQVAMSPLAYAFTQAGAIAGYLLRSVWPQPLVFDYGDYLAPLTWSTVLCALLVLGLAAGTLVALVRKPVWGFAGAVFFGVLAPSSSIVPVATQTIADHRMYLPLIIVLTALVLGAHAWLGRRAWLLAAVAVPMAGALTFTRNLDFATPLTLWADTVRKRPQNARAHNNLAAALFESHRVDAGLAEAHEALRLKPDYADALRNLAQAELRAGNPADALAPAKRAQQIEPDAAGGWMLLGDAEMAQEAFSAAAKAYAEAHRLLPHSTEATFRLAMALFQDARNDEAIPLFAEVEREHPDHPRLHLNYGGALLDAGQPAPALREFDAALAQDLPTAQIFQLRATALVQLGRNAEAAAAVRQALKLSPDYAPALEAAHYLGVKTD